MNIKKAYFTKDGDTVFYLEGGKVASMKATPNTVEVRYTSGIERVYTNETVPASYINIIEEANRLAREDARKQRERIVNASYVRGQVILVDLGKSSEGSEQSGVRPVVVIQNNIGNKFSPNLIVACITSKMTKKPMPTHIHITYDEANKIGLNAEGLILFEQIRTISKTRIKKTIGSIPQVMSAKIDEKIMLSLGINIA